ncbi:oxidoreductase [Paraflavitalea sp. CAU 1676]|uniref:YCF48-related protein n=1 Tax=Paraflavitalea sp. CAU 1676 TaxID=3032598 RepID=UPI0023DA56B3|nr:oxidoreductase [Paraflavitalea sp. CAU 1676]MDF2190191.1 oxidoreductase [Paraflavitalea sp. CAU 1676]
MMTKLSWITPLLAFSSLAGTENLNSTPTAYAKTLQGQPALTDTPKVQLLTSGTETSLRGLSVVNDKVVWVSGSKGKVGRSVDGGVTWQWTTVPGFEKRDFRDIEAFDEKTAVIIAIAEPANILRTEDGGATWTTVFTDTTKGMFLDAMDFADNKKGIVVGDPIDGKVYLATTSDGGKSWAKLKAVTIPAKEGEGFFAASGTNIVYEKNGLFSAVSGGKVSRFVDPRNTFVLDITQGREMTGPNSIATHGQHAAIVAGDYENNKDTTKNCLISFDGMKTWQAPVKGPKGYRSCVIYLDERSLVTCGTAGIDISTDGGKYWHFISPEAYHVCQKAKKGKAVFFAGGNGRIAKLVH